MKSVAIEICKVRCSGHMHRIGMCGGAIVLMDHPRGEREAMEVRKALAPDAKPPRWVEQGPGFTLKNIAGFIVRRNGVCAHGKTMRGAKTALARRMKA